MHDLSNIHLAALRAVEAVARLGTLKAAADALGVTSGAISQQVLKAEAQMGVTLFRRTPKGMVLTPVGREIASHLTEGFEALLRGVSVAQSKIEDSMTVSVAPVFAAKWLVRRLGEFAKLEPDIRVRIDASGAHVMPRPGDVDVCIRVGRGDWAGVAAERILPQRVFPVCAPGFAEQVPDLAALTTVPIIRQRSNTLFGWDVWLAPNGMAENMLGEGPVFSDASLCLDAASAGQGVFLALETLARDAIDMGQLVPALPGRFPTEVAYWFVEPKGVRRPPHVKAFRDWLFAALSL
ncbi:LysR substrate-binding domain-containing protein [Epibacterium ulvae]|uniref:LysR substrate-binding domain-containing protein n=1 Tax=Epibacterium ulvae TaxID=1156985 RepID=UPI0024931C89|nr:LysR substrate-binding domain-containing protein [Epibacterium ulvae]